LLACSHPEFSRGITSSPGEARKLGGGQWPLESLQNTFIIEGHVKAKCSQIIHCNYSGTLQNIGLANYNKDQKVYNIIRE
jgi:hypothetical protein